MSEYYPPEHGIREFNCPSCGVYATQSWNEVVVYDQTMERIGRDPVKDAVFSFEKGQVEVSVCLHCRKSAFWLAGDIIYPSLHRTPPINNDLPDDIKQVCNEATAIANLSPRATCALLRLAIEMLLEHCGKTGSLNTNIKNLVREGVDQQIQQALDIVRVTGNHAIHPGTIVFDDTTDIQALFTLINIITVVLITQPKQIRELYDNLPEKDLKAIEKRDETNS